MTPAEEIITEALEVHLLENSPDATYRDILNEYVALVHRLLETEAGLSQPSKS